MRQKIAVRAPPSRDITGAVRRSGRDVEPLLEPDVYEKVTELLCEITSYDMMSAFHLASKARAGHAIDSKTES